MRKVYFRADGNSQIGLGHVIRSCAVAEMLRNEFDCYFLIRQPSAYLQAEIKKSGCTLVELPDTISYETEVAEWVLSLDGSEIVVLDGYHFTTDYQQTLKQRGNKLVCIDDIHAYHFVADVVINHGANDASLYSKEANTKLLLGPAYCLLRQPFLQRTNRKEGHEIRKALICFGGADKLNLTTTYLHRLLRIGIFTSVHVVAGGAFPHMNRLKAVQQKAVDKEIFIHKNLPAEALSSLMMVCDVAIVPGSTIALECASMNIPMLSGFYVGNQINIDAMLSRSGMSISLGDFTNISEQDFHTVISQLVSPAYYKEMQQKQRLAFDGRSAERVLSMFEKLGDHICV